jgi:hypothetical protein
MGSRPTPGCFLKLRGGGKQQTRHGQARNGLCDRRRWSTLPRERRHIEGRARYQVPCGATGEWPRKPLVILTAALVGGVGHRRKGRLFFLFPEV